MIVIELSGLNTLNGLWLYAEVSRIFDHVKWIRDLSQLQHMKNK